MISRRLRAGSALHSLIFGFLYLIQQVVQQVLGVQQAVLYLDYVDSSYMFCLGLFKSDAEVKPVVQCVNDFPYVVV